MNAINIDHKILSGLLVMLLFCLFVPQNAFCQAEKMDIVQYMPPSGWTKTPKDFGVVFSDVNEKTVTFCILTVYASEKAAGDASKIFADQWTKLMVKQFNAPSAPNSESVSADGWITTAGASKVTVEDGEALALLTVFSGFGRSVSVTAVFNEESYLKPLDAFVNGIKLDKTPPTVQKNPAAGSNTPASIYGIWSDTSVSIANYVTPSGTFVGSADVSIMKEYEFRRDNTYVSKFFGSGGVSKPYYSETTGTFRIDGNKLTLTPLKKRGGYSGAIGSETAGKPETFEFYIGPNKWEPGPFLNLHKAGNYYLYEDFPYDYFKKIDK